MDSPTRRGGPIQDFYTPSARMHLPTIDRAEGVWMSDTSGKRYLDASSGPVASNLGHSNPRVVAAMTAQAGRAAFASRAHFVNEPNVRLAGKLAELCGEGLDKAFIVSGGSEATEAAIKLARQWAVATGQPQRTKVLGRDPGYHGSTLGALAVTGDPDSDAVFGDIARVMPKVPAPFTYRLPPNHDADSNARAAAEALDRAIREEGAETVLAFLMEPVGGLATGALVAPDAYYTAVREICTRHGVLLIYDEVMSGAGRTGRFLAADHWPGARPDMVTLAKGVAAGYTPLGALMAPAAMVEAVAEAGGFLHGHTFCANPLSCAVGAAVLDELTHNDLMSNAAAMGALLRGRLEDIAGRSRVLGDVRGKGLLMAIEIVSDRDSKAIFPGEARAIPRIIALGMERGLLLYSRRTAGGRYGEWLMISPPLIIAPEEVDELVTRLEDTLRAFEAEAL